MSRHPTALSASSPPVRGFAQLDQADFPPFDPGTVWLCGAGPGAPGLLSLTGFHALQHADVVVYDALVNPQILAWVRPDAQIEYAGKRGGKPSMIQQSITRRLIELAGQNKRVLRLKGGDPFVFGRGGEECQEMVAAGVQFRIIPGISSGVGGLAYAGIPVTHRDTNQSVLFLTGHDAQGDTPTSIDWSATAKAANVIVMYMAVKHLPTIAQLLVEHGRAASDPIAVVSNATLPDQTVFVDRLGTFVDDQQPHDLPTPAIVVVGGVAGYHRDFDWYIDQARTHGMG